MHYLLSIINRKIRQRQEMKSAVNKEILSRQDDMTLSVVLDLLIKVSEHVADFHSSQWSNKDRIYIST